MRTRSISTATALAVLFSSAALVAGTAGTAVADSAKKLSVKSVADLVVDGVNQRVYVSDPTLDKIVVTDYSGKEVGSFTGLTDVDGLVLSADSSRLYAAVPGKSSIVAIETDSGRQIEHPLGAKAHTLALAGGKVWFGYNGEIGSLDVSGAEPVVALAQAPDSQVAGIPKLAASPADPAKLVLGGADSDTGLLEVYDVSGAAPARTAVDANVTYVRDLAVTPDGTRVVTAGGNSFVVRKASDLTQVSNHQSDYYGNAVAVGGPQDAVAGGVGTASYGPDVYVYRAGSAKAVRTYDFVNPGYGASDTLLDNALAWEPGGGRLFAVTDDALSESFELRVLTDPTKALPQLTVDAPATSKRGKSLTVKGKLTATVPLPAGTTVDVVRTDAESPKGKSLGAKKVDAKGAYSFKDSPSSGGKVTYKVSYKGGAAHAPVSGSDKVDVSRDKTTLTLDKNKKIYKYGSTVNFTAKLGKTYKDRTVSIYADPAGDGKGRKLVKSGKVNSSGKFSAKVKLTRDTTVTAVFDGDSRTASKSAKSWVGSKVKISSSYSRHYKTQRISGKTYHLYKTSREPVITTKMTNYKDRRQLLTLEYYAQGSWHNLEVTPAFFPLGTNGVSEVTLTGSGKGLEGIKFRMRSSYVNGAYYDNWYGDTVHSTTRGSWKYFMFR